MASLRLCGGWRATRLTVTEKDVRYTVTITEYHGDGAVRLARHGRG
jgi:hypothetical protein